MNERIKELVELATEEFSPTFERDKWQERFAELIVGECCDQITQEPFNAGAASDWLKQHFGI